MKAEITGLVKREIQKIDPNAVVILFGSRARNEAKDDSDWDFLILLSRALTGEVKDEIREKLYDLELATDEVISSIIYTTKSWEELAVTPIHQTIEKEGVAI